MTKRSISASRSATSSPPRSARGGCAAITAASAAALMKWEPRIKLASISVSRPGEASAIIEIVGTVDTRTLTTSLPLRGAL